jgi:hypothetical protein
VARRDVFVSYSSSDHATAHEVVSRVEAEGIECWIAPRDMPPAADWPAEIVRAITAARVMVLVLSAGANDSAQVRREVMLAIDKGVRVVPFRTADVAPAGILEFFLSGQHWLDAFPPPLEPHLDKLVTCLNTLLATPTNPPPPEARALSAKSQLDHVHSFVLPAATLHHVESELAIYIGPIAQWVVNRAAAGASNLDALLHQLGEEIESETERRKFITVCGQWLRDHS